MANRTEFDAFNIALIVLGGVISILILSIGGVILG